MQGTSAFQKTFTVQTPREDDRAHRQVKDVAGAAIPFWGPRLMIDGLTAEIHAPERHRVDLSLSRHLFTFWLNHAETERAINHDRLRAQRFPMGSFNFTPAGSTLKSVGEHPTKALLISMDPQFLRRSVSACSENKPLPALAGQVNATITHIGRLFEDFFRNGQVGGRLYFESLGILLAVEAFKQCFTDSAHKEGHTALLSSSPIKRALEFIRQNIDRDLSISQIAQVAGMSPYHFARCFKKATGSSPHRYLIHLRINQAMQLLKAPDRSIADVALSCGFSDQSHFTHTFKHVVGLTPVAYRRLPY